MNFDEFGRQTFLESKKMQKNRILTTRGTMDADRFQRFPINSNHFWKK
jgi:hypothetical protein